MKNKKVLIIDGNNYCYKAYFAYNRLSYKGKLSNVVYGTITLVEKLIRDIKPDKTIFIVDRNRHEKRIEVLPDYKQSRKQKIGFEPESFFEQRHDVCTLLSQGFNVQCIAIKGQEADDLIYKEMRKSLKLGYDVVIASADKDFHQLITEDVSILSAKKDTILLTKDNLINHHGYNPNQVVDYLSLLGDNSDNIPGYKGIGETKALDFVKKHSIRKFLKDETLSYKGINKETLKEVYNKNRVLIDLKYFNRKFNKLKNYKSLNEYSKPKFDEDVIKDISISYGINMFRTKIFQKTFK